MKNYVIGIDVGGTNIKYGLVTPTGEIVYRKVLKTKDYSSRAKLIPAMVEGAARLLKEHGVKKRQVKGIGMGLPGLVDVRNGIVKFLPNIPGWKDVPLRTIFEHELGIPTCLENDVNMITLGEWKYGAGAGEDNLICITLGTGVGGGLVFNRGLYRGDGFAAGEIGHIPINENGPACSCGGRGCFERYVGNQQLQVLAGKIFRDKAITLEEVTARAVTGDARALRFWEDTGVRIGHGLIGVVNLLNPRLLVIGGGVSNSHRFLFPAIRRTVKQRAMVVQGRMFRIKRAKLGNDAGIIGARVLLAQGE